MSGEKDMQVDAIVEKINNGQTITKEEETFLLKSEGAPEGYAGTDDSKVAVETEETPPEKTPEELKKEEDDKAAKDKKDQEEKEARASKAKALGLKEDATEEEIKAAEETNDPFFKIERELSKEEGKENLDDFSDREKAYFHQMRKDRKARQEAEKDRDGAKFELIKLKKEKAPGKPEEKKEEDPLKELKEKDPTDFVSIADVLKIVEDIKAKPAEAKREAPAIDPVRRNYLAMCDEKAKAAHTEDYDAVMELTPEIVDNNERYQMDIAQALVRGENPALKMYELIKGDPEFAKLYPAAKTKVDARKAAEKPEGKKEEKKPEKTPEELKKEKELADKEKLLEVNKNKSKTTGHASAGDDKPAGEYSLEEITNMSQAEFSALPKKVRDAYLEKYG